MHFSPLRALQWLGIALFVAATVGLTYDFESEASKTVNAPVENRLSQGLLGYWKMDEGTGTSTTADASGNANALTMTAMESGDWVAGQIGAYALDFDGSAEWLTVADPSSGVLDIVDGADFTITGWFNRDTFTTDDTIVAKRNGIANTDDGYILYIDDATDQLIFEVSEAGGTDEYQVASTSTFTATGWNHFAVVWNDSNAAQTEIYVNGKADNGTDTGTIANLGDLSNTVAFDIGAESDNGNPFDGKIDDIKLYGKALSEDAVKRLYQTTVPGSPVDTGLVGHWTFDGPDVVWGDASNEIKDVSGKGNHGDAVSLTASSVTPGKLGQGLQFNGTSDVVNITGLSLPDWQTTSGYTISMWVKNFPDDIQDIALFEVWNSGDNYERIQISSNDFVPYQRLQILAGRQYESRAGYIDGYEYDSISKTTEWHHLVVTANSTKLTLFYNGSEVASDTDIETYGSFTFNSIRIGGGASNYYGNASATYAQTLIDDVRVYNRTLSGTEIANLYNAGK